MRGFFTLFLLLTFAAAAGAQQRFKDDVFGVKFTPDIVYATAPVRAPAACEKDMLLDLFEPENADRDAQRPAIVLLHGGAFRMGAREGPESFADLCVELASRGYVCASTEYRLEGDDPEEAGATLRERTITAAIRDVAAAVRWLTRNAAAHRIDTSRIAVGGASAGAVAALGLAYSPEGRKLRIRAVLDVSGLMIAPLDAMQPHDAPLLIIHGTNDTLVPFAAAVAVDQRASAVGVPHQFIYGEGKANGHVRRLQLTLHGRTMLDHIVGFLDEYLAR